MFTSNFICITFITKKFLFTHNDLHINNIMYTKTDRTFLYYKFNNIYFKVPTFGYIFKIIDFGRSIFTFNNKVFFNDTFLINMEKQKDNIHILINIYYL